MDYYELRTALSKIVPRMTQLQPSKTKVNMVREKGRKGNYHQFHLGTGEWRKQERLLNTEEISSFLEISLRAAACPMPLNLDAWDGVTCQFGCRYCYANAFRASLYTSFFDNAKTLGLRHCNPEYYKRELDKKMGFRGQDPHSIVNSVNKAVAMEIPMRFGIRFEDFLPREKRMGVSLTLLKYLAEHDYPVMINTKSDLIGHDDYIQPLADNGAGAAVHVTMISSDNKFLRRLEPGAPTFEKRLGVCRNLVQAGIRTVARIEPFMIFLNDERSQVEDYIERVWDAGVRNITFDTYSYSANNPGIRQEFLRQGYDFERMFLLGCDSQRLGSLILSRFMDLFRDKGFSCSTFDLGNVPSNDQSICCEVGDWFKAGYNYGCAVSAVRFITRFRGRPVSWKRFATMVNNKGGFLSQGLEEEIHRLWNLEGNDSYGVDWGQGIEPAGRDEDGLIWAHVERDRREELLEDVI